MPLICPLSLFCRPQTHSLRIDSYLIESRELFLHHFLFPSLTSFLSLWYLICILKECICIDAFENALIISTYLTSFTIEST